MTTRPIDMQPNWWNTSRADVYGVMRVITWNGVSIENEGFKVDPKRCNLSKMSIHKLVFDLYFSRNIWLFASLPPKQKIKMGFPAKLVATWNSCRLSSISSLQVQNKGVPANPKFANVLVRMCECARAQSHIRTFALVSPHKVQMCECARALSHLSKINFHTTKFRISTDVLGRN